LTALLLLTAGKALAATAFVTDELVLGVYAEQNGQGQRLTTLHSGASVETLNVNGEFTQVRLTDGTTGWVKSVYLTTQVPAVVRIKQLEEELDQSRATTPALAEAAARSEVQQLKRELANMQAASAAAAAAAPAAGSPIGAAATSAVPGAPWSLVAAILAALGCGFWLGYATLARRIKHKFGGLKVY
jgi:hypothetical protein